MRGNASIVASLLTRSRDPSPLLRYPSVYSCCLATNDARRFVMARLGMGKTPLRQLLRNRGSVFWCYSSCVAQIRHNMLCTFFENRCPSSPHVSQAIPTAAQKTPWLAHLHPRLRGNVASRHPNRSISRPRISRDWTFDYLRLNCGNAIRGTYKFPYVLMS
jgi:hypothetical protein